MSTKKKQDRMAWFKMDAGKFLVDTLGYSPTHRGIYASLMCLYWINGNRITEDETTLRRKLGITTEEENQALKEVLAEFFPGNDHRDLDEQLEAVKETSRMQSEKAKSRHAARSSAVDEDLTDF